MEREKPYLSAEVRKAQIIRLATTTRMTQEEIGQRFGISQARISQILIAAKRPRGRGTSPRRRRRHEMLRLLRVAPEEATA